MAKAKINYEDTEIQPSNEQMAELATMAENYVSIETAISDTEALLSRLKEQKWALVRDDLPLLMKHLGFSKFTLANGIEINVSDGIAVAVSQKNKPAAFQWLKDNNAGSLVKGSRTIMFDANETKEMIAFDKLWKGKKRWSDLMQVTEGAHTGSLKAFFKTFSEEHGGIPDKVSKLFGIYEFKETKIKFPKNWDMS